MASFKLFESKWNAKYPREVQSWQDDLEDLLVFYKSPESTRYAIYTTNAIERTIKEIRKRVKPMNIIANLEAAEKIVYLFATDYNEKMVQASLTRVCRTPYPGNVEGNVHQEIWNDPGIDARKERVEQGVITQSASSPS